MSRLIGTSVIIPVFNNWRLTERCLETLFANTPADLLADVIVVDNGSDDGTGLGLRRFSGVTSIRFPENRGFAVACNAGASIARGNILFFLNNDAFAHPGAVAALAQALDDPHVGIAGARLLYGDGSLQHAGMVACVGQLLWHLHVHLDGDLPDAQIPRDYLSVTGAAMAVRDEVFRAAGGFDEGYRNGYEDVDLCMRAWEAGYRVRYEPRSTFTHLESATSGRFAGEADNNGRFFGRWGRALESVPRLELSGLPAPGLLGDLASGSVAAQAGRHFMRNVRASGLPVRYYVAGTAPLAPEPQAWANETFNPAVFIDWLEPAAVTIEGRKRVLFLAPADAVEAKVFERVRFDAIWTPTFAARDLLLAAGVPRELVEVVRTGADNLAFGPNAQPFDFKIPSPLIVAYASRVTSDAALSSMLTVLGGVRSETALVLLTDLPGATLQARLVRVAGELGADVTANRRISIVSTDGSPDALVPGFFTAARVFLMPEAPEPTGFVLMCAMSAAAPIVAGDVPALREFLSPESALLGADAATMIAAADRALADPASMRTQRESAQFDAVRQYSVQLSVRRTRELLRRLCWGDVDGGAYAMTPDRAAALRAAMQRQEATVT